MKSKETTKPSAPIPPPVMEFADDRELSDAAIDALADLLLARGLARQELLDQVPEELFARRS